MAAQRSPESELLGALARSVAMAHRGSPHVVAAMVTGSVAKGLADTLSDIDMAVYYDGPLPDDDALAERCAGLGGTGRRPLGPRQPDAFIEAFELAGVEVQLIHATVASVDDELDEVLVRHVVDTPLHKAVEGILCCQAFYGAPVIEVWRARAAAFPPALGLAMIRRYLSFFPAWGVPGQMLSRDGTIWVHQVLVESAQNLLGVLAGLNHVYYTPFQHKRLARFVDGLALAPADLAPRLESLFLPPRAQALLALEALVSETVTLLQTHRPEIDTTLARRRIGWRKAAWVWDEVARLG